MAYHIFTAPKHSSGDEVFDKYLGSATTVGLYWEAVGEKKSLPIISSITERADSEDGFTLVDSDLVEFKRELEELHEFWMHSSSEVSVPEDFFVNLDEIKLAIEQAISEDLQLMIG